MTWLHTMPQTHSVCHKDNEVMINKYTVTEFLLTFNENRAIFYNYKQCRTD